MAPDTLVALLMHTVSVQKVPVVGHGKFTHELLTHAGGGGLIAVKLQPLGVHVAT